MGWLAGAFFGVGTLSSSAWLGHNRVHGTLFYYITTMETHWRKKPPGWNKVRGTDVNVDDNCIDAHLTIICKRSWMYDSNTSK
jgi:hypothetical protein